MDGDQVYSSLCGLVQTNPAQVSMSLKIAASFIITEASISNASFLQGNSIEVIRAGIVAPHVPAVGDVVLSRVTRINRRLCTTEIVQIGDHALAVPFQGVIRVQDVRASEIDKVCFSAHLKHRRLTGGIDYV